jgi:hypothetical protein
VQPGAPLWQQAAIVVQPAYVEDSPRALMAALARGVARSAIEEFRPILAPEDFVGVNQAWRIERAAGHGCLTSA